MNTYIIRLNDEGMEIVRDVFRVNCVCRYAKIRVDLSMEGTYDNTIYRIDIPDAASGDMRSVILMRSEFDVVAELEEEIV